MIYSELCQRILFEAQRGGEKAEQANLNTQSVVEAIMPSVLQDVALACWADPNKRSLLRSTVIITVANGVGTLPETVLTEGWSGAMILEPNDEDVLPADISFVPEYVDFVTARDYEDRLGYWCIRGDYDFHYVSPDGDYNEFDGDIEYTGASIPEIPAADADDTGWPSEIESDVIDRAAELLRGAKLIV